MLGQEGWPKWPLCSSPGLLPSMGWQNTDPLVPKRQRLLLLELQEILCQHCRASTYLRADIPWEQWCPTESGVSVLPGKAGMETNSVQALLFDSLNNKRSGWQADHTSGSSCSSWCFRQKPWITAWKCRSEKFGAQGHSSMSYGQKKKKTFYTERVLSKRFLSELLTILRQTITQLCTQLAASP